MKLQDALGRDAMLAEELMCALGRDDLEYQVMKSAIDVALDVERALLRGVRDDATKDGARTMNGLDAFIDSELDNKNGVLSINGFEAFLDPLLGCRAKIRNGQRVT